MKSKSIFPILVKYENDPTPVVVKSFDEILPSTPFKILKCCVKIDQDQQDQHEAKEHH